MVPTSFGSVSRVSVEVAIEVILYGAISKKIVMPLKINYIVVI